MKSDLNISLLKSKQNANMLITKALLKHGHEYFSVVIIEYIDPDSLSERETYWILKLKTYYNLLKYGNSSLPRKREGILMKKGSNKCSLYLLKKKTFR
jgi:group I intron endonuclease